ncbi:hypothetical protein LCGC14_0410170 [marine sediment metagenome]|uniref:Uncharacterized protein n=1 Tax=marine sediment metagenome TaxID=412755 RepID=A0A0F9W383_9ZZZZ
MSALTTYPDTSAQDQLREWFTNRGFRPKHLRWEWNSEDGRVVFSTTKNNYFVVFKAAYLGMGASSRLARPGETWLRGNDLPDGKFSKETFDKMMDAVLMYELRAVSEEQALPPWELEKPLNIPDPAYLTS